MLYCMIKLISFTGLSAAKLLFIGQTHNFLFIFLFFFFSFSYVLLTPKAVPIPHHYYPFCYKALEL